MRVEGCRGTVAQLAKVGYGEFWDEEKAILEICLAESVGKVT
jgi:hypothetical protein